MLTVNITPTFGWTYLEYNGQGRSPEQVLIDDTLSSYFYIAGGTPSARVTESLYFNIAPTNMDNVPSSAIIDHIVITLRTVKTNAYAIYDAINIKYNGRIIANIDATSHGSAMKVSQYQTATLNGTDISKDALSGTNFEIEMSTEGPNPFELFYIDFQVTYSETVYTSICKIVVPDGLAVLPLYNPLSLSRYSLRIMTDGGIKSFDLVETDNPDASLIIVVTPYGHKAIRQLPII